MALRPTELLSKLKAPGRRARVNETEIDPDTGDPYAQGVYIPGPISSLSCLGRTPERGQQ